MGGESAEPVRLAWVTENGVLRHVSAFAHLPPADRPVVRCPVCHEALTLKLGRVVTHHAAHQRDSHCALGTEETALHYNTKHYLARALREHGGPVTVRVRCGHRFGVLGDTVASPGLVPCTASVDEVLVEWWDEVRVEQDLSTTRPDVLLLTGGTPVALIEVRRTNAVTAEKIERLAAIGVPWAEVIAARSLYADLVTWTPERPLTVVRTARHARWWCEAHAGRTTAEPREHSTAGAPWIARVVDLFAADGRAVRDVVYVSARVRGKRVTEATLRHRQADDTIAPLPNGTTTAVRAAAHAAFLDWTRVRRARGEHVDSPMSWAAARLLLDETHGWIAGTSLYPPRFEYDREHRRWARRPGVGTRTWAYPARLVDE